MTSDDDINKISQIIRLVAHKIFKNKFFNQLVQTTAITPRHKKPEQPVKPVTRKRRSTPPPQTPSSLKKKKKPEME
jgi:hypothetical protein